MQFVTLALKMDIIPLFRPILYLAVLFCAAPAVANPNPVTAEQTIAYELLEVEARLGTVPEGSLNRLSLILNGAYQALGQDYRGPNSPAEFVSFATAVSTFLAGDNFIQPVERADWTSSIGDSFAIVPSDHPRLQAYLQHPQNHERLAHISTDDPLYFMDCDIASLIIISVAQMVGFEVNLVEVPNHNFVRWGGHNETHANWDWTNWGSHTDETYARSFRVTPTQILRKVYLITLGFDEARAYYLSVMADNFEDQASRLAVRRMSIDGAYRNPTSANNVAWTFATIADDVTEAERRSGVSYALDAWSAKPDDTNVMDTVACSLAAAGRRTLAAAVQRDTIRIAGSQSLNNYEENLRRIENGELCQ